MTTKIFLIRHAEAEGNLFRVAHGQYDSIIMPRGYRQLAYLRQRFLDQRLDAVYGSDLTRTHITASALYVPRGLPFRPMPQLREICLGRWEQMSWGEIQRQDRQMYINFNKRPDLWRAEGAETFAQVRDRTVAGIRQIAAENPGKTVAAASHGAALRTLLGTLQGLSLEEIGSTGHGDNTAVSLLEVSGEDIRVGFRGAGRPRPCWRRRLRAGWPWYWSRRPCGLPPMRLSPPSGASAMGRSFWGRPYSSPGPGAGSGSSSPATGRWPGTSPSSVSRRPPAGALRRRWRWTSAS